MNGETESKIQDSNLSNAELISHFREKCKICGHHRIMHNELGASAEAPSTGPMATIFTPRSSNSE